MRGIDLHGGAQQTNGFTLTLTEESFLRDMPHSSFRRIADDLNIEDGWERVAERIPDRAESIDDFTCNFVPRYTAMHMMRFAAKNQRRGDSAAKALLTDWSTTNVKIKHLVAILHQCKFWKLTNYIEKDVLGKNHVARNVAFLMRTLRRRSEEPEIVFARNLLQEACNSPNQELAAALLKDNHLAEFDPLIGTMEQRVSHASHPNIGEAVHAGAPPSPASHTREMSDTATSLLALLSTEEKVTAVRDKVRGDTPHDFHLLKKISFQILKIITNNFDDGAILGEGGFGKVYLATFNKGLKVAVKYLKENSDDTLDQFKTEVETLCAFKHPNVVRLLGYSIDGERRCLIYQYMINGSLDDRLACTHNTPPLSVPMRVEIVKGTAKGIAFLNKGGLTHRDIKTGNILLDEDFTPKVADFATARVAPIGQTKDLQHASVLIGSPAYLAPEAFNLTIHPKLDSFSFGVVLLEILTGLPVLDSNRENQDLKYHVKEHCAPVDDDDDDDDEKEEQGSIFDLLDQKGGKWDRRIVDILYNVSERCLTMIPNQRPTVADVLPELESWVVNVGESDTV